MGSIKKVACPGWFGPYLGAAIVGGLAGGAVGWAINYKPTAGAGVLLGLVAMYATRRAYC